MKTHYAVLGVTPDANFETIKAAYRRGVKANHPDLHDGDSAFERHSRLIIAAYDVLKDPEQRSRYDLQLQSGRRRRRILIITGVVVACLVSSTTLIVLNFLFKPETNPPFARDAREAPKQIALIESPPVEAAPKEAPISGASRWVVPAEVPVRVPNPPEPTLVSPFPVAQVLPPDSQAGAPQKAESVGGTEAEPAAAANAKVEVPNPEALRDKAAAPGAEHSAAQPDHMAAQNIVTGAVPPHEAGSALPDASFVQYDAQDEHGEQVVTAIDSDQSAKPVGGADKDQPASGDTSGHLALATELAAKGDLDHALVEYDAAVGLDANSIAALHGRGMVRWRRGDFDRALADLDHAIRLSFSNPEIYCDRGVIWSERGRYDRAIADFSQAIKLDPKHTDGYFHRGVVLRRKGEFKAAIADLDQAIRLDPTLAGARRNRELALSERTEPADEPPQAVH